MSEGADSIPEAPFDVIIVGFGPVGAAVANLLGRYQVRTLVIDKAEDIFQAPRAIALDNEALRILQMMGLDDRAFARVPIPQVRMRSPMLGEYACADTSREIDGHPQLVTFYQPELEAVLRRRLADYPTVEVQTGVTLVGLDQDDSGVTVHLDKGGRKISVRAAHLVGADGASSTVRQFLKLDFKGRSFAQDWLIVDAKSPPEPISDVEFWCDPRRPGPHMIAPGGRERWEFMLQPGETPADMERDTVAQRLLEPWTKGSQIEIERIAVYRFHARAADAFSSGRCHLVGDAAHITPPFAGQGLVAGLRDAANLSWKLAWVTSGRCSPAVLDSYDVERRPHAKATIKFALFLGALVMPRNRIRALLTHGALRASQYVPGLRSMFRELRMKPKNAFRKGLFLPCGGRSAWQPGAQFPQVKLRPAGGGHPVASDDILGDRMMLVGLGAAPLKGIDPVTLARWARFGGETIHILAPGNAKGAPDCFEDVSGILVPAAARTSHVAIVRPDRTIVAIGPADKAAELVSRTLDLFEAPPAAPMAFAADQQANGFMTARNERAVETS
jgi:3-(3-hydroxy-phenyl)propionate hydroxylase